MASCSNTHRDEGVMGQRQHVKWKDPKPWIDFGRLQTRDCAPVLYLLIIEENVIMALLLTEAHLSLDLNNLTLKDK